MSATRPRPPGAPAFDRATEGLRGMAALMVVYTHMLTPFPHLDPGYAVSPLFWAIETSQGAVLLFFVLSGYVIGLTNSGPCTVSRGADYARRRALRLVPLYVLAVFLGVMAVPTDSWRTIGANLLFLENKLPYGSVLLPPIAGNSNLWTLNYEVLYYSLFPLIWLRPERWPVWLGGSVALGVAGWWLPAGQALLTGYAVGWTFWLGGYALARARSVSPATEAPLPWPSLLLLWSAIWLLKPGWHIAHRFGLLYDHPDLWINWSFYDFLPPCLCLMMVTTGRRPRIHRWLVTGTLLLPVCFLLWTILRGRASDILTNAGTYYSVTAVALWKWRPANHAFVRLAPIGGISYGIYIFHSPIQYLIAELSFLPAGSLASYLLRCALGLGAAFLLAWWAEKRLQPWIRAKLSRRPVPARD
ncbi:MAG TPA: acyltransferase [Opitutaceae bacterium]|nr:acyltransferase [Opitutaceae bacterium]